MTYSKALPALILMPLAFPAIGADNAQPTPRPDPIVVTATIGPQTVGESLSSVTVVDEEAIRTQNPAEFQDLLRGQPGVSVVGNGSFGKATSVYTRGTTNDSTLFLVDGVRLRSATSGGAAWQYFPAELVERVEIVRGPRSALYGADAVGGVIQAFTLDPEQGNRGWLEVGAGNFDSQKVAAGAGASAGNTRFSVSGLHKESDGTAVLVGGEDKGFRNTAGVARVVHELENGGQASLVYLQSEGSTAYDGGDMDFLISTLGMRLDTSVSDNWQSSVQFAESRDETENFTAFSNAEFDTRSRSARWENTFTLDVHELVLGAEMLADEVSGTTDFVETSRSNTAMFSQLRLNFGPTDLMFSLRGDDNEAFGKQETGGVALGHSFDRSHRVRLSYGTAFRAPTFNDLYYPLEVYDFGGAYSGNPDLKPEESGTVEVGFSGDYYRWFWDVAVYQLDVENLIALRTDDAGLMAPENVDKARVRGAEFAAGFDSNGWKARAALTLADPRNRATDNRLRRRSAQALRLDLDKTIDTWSFGGSVVAEGYRYDDAANARRLPGYGTLDLRAGWRFAQDWTGRLTLANVLDKEYATSERYDGARYVAAGRTAMLTVRYDIQ